MAGYIGGIACDIVSGNAAALKQRVERWELTGIDGYGAQLLGKGDSPFAFTAIKFGSGAAVDSWFANLEALQGTIVTIVDDCGTSRTSLLIERVLQLQKSVAYHQGGARGETTVEGVKTN